MNYVSTSHRSDIDFLRAISVVAVVVYHLPVASEFSGFIGVDVFFVISGYLITTILRRSLAEENFSAREFLFRRFQRLFLPVWFMLVVFFVVAWLSFPTYDLQRAAKEGWFSIVAMSNIFYGFQGNYFSDPLDKFFLHTWSLSVEVQFYLFVAFLGLTLLKIQRISAPGYFILFGILLGFVAMIWVASVKATVAFYLMPTRLWEFALGGLVCMFSVENNSHKKLLAGIGYMVLFTSPFVVFGDRNWPGYSTLAPTLGATLVLLSSYQLNMFSSKLVRWLGSRSYAIYLWHWPLISLFYFWGFGDLFSTFFLCVSVIALTVVLAEISYLFIERRGGLSYSMRRSTQVLLLLAMLSFLVCGTFGKLPDENRVPGWVDLVASEKGNVDPRRSACTPIIHSRNLRLCEYGNGEGQLSAILAGDSFASMYAPALGEAVNRADGKIVLLAKNGCPPFFGATMDRNAKECTQFLSATEHYISTQPAQVPLVLAFANYFSTDESLSPKFNVGKSFSQQSDEYYSDAIETVSSMICNVARGRTLYLINPIPNAGQANFIQVARQWFLNLQAPLQFSMARADFEVRHERARNLIRKIQSRCGALIIPADEIFCSGELCRLGENNRPYFSDASHLSLFGASKMIDQFSQVIK